MADQIKPNGQNHEVRGRRVIDRHSNEAEPAKHRQSGDSRHVVIEGPAPWVPYLWSVRAASRTVFRRSFSTKEAIHSSSSAARFLLPPSVAALIDQPLLKLGESRRRSMPFGGKFDRDGPSSLTSCAGSRQIVDGTARPWPAIPDGSTERCQLAHFPVQEQATMAKTRRKSGTVARRALAARRKWSTRWDVPRAGRAENGISIGITLSR